MSQILPKDIPLIQDLLQQVLGIDRYETIQRLGGLTNHTYKITTETGGEYIVRIPGEGTEELIDRNAEYISTKLACELGIDAELLHFGSDGSKITTYIPNAQTMSPETMKEDLRIRQAAAIFRKLHSCGVDTHVPFEVFDMAKSYEAIIAENHVPLYEDYSAIKNEIMSIKSAMDAQRSPVRVPCHNDSLCENWVASSDRLYLIDWEYAGMNDGMWDLADISIEADYNDDQDTLLLTSYLERDPSLIERQAFWANKLYLDYLWTLWGKTRVPYDGQPMEDYATERYIRLKANLKKYYDLRKESTL